MSSATTPSGGVSFAAPGPGQWALDRSHYPGGTTRISMSLMDSGFAPGLRRAFASIGTPVDTVEAKFVNGFMYTRLRPLIGANKPAKKLPPNVVLAVATRLHPAFRVRNKAATKTFATRPWRAVVADWEHSIRPMLVQTNDQFGSVDVARCSDVELTEHVDALIAHLRSTFETHFWLHGFDLGPVAMYVHGVGELGIPAADAIAALSGASPTTSAPIGELAQINVLLEATGCEPTTLEQIRGASPALSGLVDAYLKKHGDHLVTRYDLDGLTLSELPAVVLSTILNAGSERGATAHPEAIAAGLRARVAEEHRAQFDDLLTEARAVMDLRDDNGPNTVERPLGILRRALLEVGRRMVVTGRATAREQVFELEPAEISSMLSDTPLVTSDVLHKRAEDRAAQARLDPPLGLGVAEPTPPLSVLPPQLRRLVSMVETAMREMGLSADRPSGVSQTDGLSGSGIGTAVYRGRVRRADNPEEAIVSMEPGDVLVVRATNPTYNAILMLAGAVVTADGGPLSHAAVLARELGISAVVGASAAMTLPDGAIVDVDPIAGKVTIVSK